MDFKCKHIPNYDKGFKPISVALKNFRQNVNLCESQEVKVLIQRNSGYNYGFTINIFKNGHEDENYTIVERLIKSSLWIAGGYKIYFSGPMYLYQRLKADYCEGGQREFDYNFMSGVYEKPFQIIFTTPENFPPEKKCSLNIGGNLDGCRIGFDAGGSDRKVSAVIDGKTVYSEEVVWNPKLSTDWKYQYDGIMDSMNRAASKMPRVDAIGVSSAGVYIDDKIMVASLFIKIPKEDYKPHVQNMYIDIGKSFGVPLKVANDGDVTALAGAMNLNDNCVLGIAMGTSEAGGYINCDGNLNDWLSELAFVPVDLNETAMEDEWSKDRGVGVKYFSQDAVIKLATHAGITFEDGLTPAQKLVVVQNMLKGGDQVAVKIFEDIGIYLGYAIGFYSEFYQIKHLLLLGRVTSFEAGEIIIRKAKEVLNDEFPQLANINLTIPTESEKRVGQSIAAASLTSIK